MFGYSILPFSASESLYFNGEIFTFTFNIGFNNNITLNIDKIVSFALNIEKDRVIVL
jgi:hypothetical protein